MINFLLATGNPHKVEELEVLLKDAPLSISAVPSKIDIEEDANTFQGNALKKALGYFDRFNRPIVSDDSGLVVGELPNELGVHSARFGGPDLDARGKCELLLEKLKDVPDEKRQAYFVCILCFYISPEENYFFEGRVNGKIATEMKGSDGFGYDPVFIPEKNPKFHLAEIPDWKNEHSHRAIASRMAVDFFKGNSRFISP